MSKRSKRKQTAGIPVYVRLLPSCGCLGDVEGFMSEMLCPCGCQEWLTKYEGLNGEQVRATVADLNADPSLTERGKYRFTLLPGIFPMNWHELGYTALIGKWSS